MEFPYYIWIGPLKVHPHIFFETLAYSLGFQLWRIRQKKLAHTEGDSLIDSNQKMWLLAAVILGAALGAKLLAWIETPWDPATGQWILPGKTIAGGLLGGWAAIEFTKYKLKIKQRTGDNYVMPLCIGIALGRIGCFLTGLDDHTYGMATNLPWAVNFGDGILRHPTQLYESGFLMLLAIGIYLLQKMIPHLQNGSYFQIFMAAYCLFRVGIETLKPSLKFYAGLSAIQAACVAGCGIALWNLFDLNKKRLESTPISEQGI